MSNPYLLAKYVAFRLPTNLCIKSSCVSKGEYAVWSIDEIPLGTRFGPYEVKVPETSRNESEGLYWQMSGLFKEDWDERASNWLWLINYTCNEEQQNVIAIRHRSTVYYITSKCIPPNTELLVFCADEDVKKASLNRGNFIFSKDNRPGMSGYGQLSPEILNAPGKEKSDHCRGLIAQEWQRVDKNSKYSEECYWKHWAHNKIKEYLYNEKRDNCALSNENLSSVSRDEGGCTKGNVTFSIDNRPGTSGYQQWSLEKQNAPGKERNRSCREMVAQELHRYDENSKYSKESYYQHSVYDTLNALNEDLYNGKIDSFDQTGRQFCKVSRNNCVPCDKEQLSNVKRQQSVDTLYLCDRCGRLFSQKHCLNRHQLIHTGEKPFKCSECNKTFRGKDDLKFHKEVHRKEKSSKFEVCGNAFKKSLKHSEERCSKHSMQNESDDLSNRKRDHFIATAKQPSGVRRLDRVPCDKGQLSNLKRDETGGPPYRCDTCGKLFSRKNNFVAHHVVHRKEKPFKCSKCDKTFKREVTFRDHQRVHSEERNYKCNICGKSFKHPGSLRVHMTTHSEERPHKCKYCSKTFKTKNNLKKHETLNCGQRPLLNEESERTFN